MEPEQTTTEVRGQVLQLVPSCGRALTRRIACHRVPEPPPLGRPSSVLQRGTEAGHPHSLSKDPGASQRWNWGGEGRVNPALWRAGSKRAARPVTNPGFYLAKTLIRESRKRQRTGEIFQVEEW